MHRTIFFLLAGASLVAQPLNFTEMKVINEKLFSYHVIFDSYNESLAERSLNKIFHSMDPVNFYFSQLDREKFVGSSKKMVREYNAGTFETYISIRETFELCVKKNRRLRAAVRYEILNEVVDIYTVRLSPPTRTPSSTHQQKQHIMAYMVGNLRGYATSKGKAKLSYEEKVRVLDYYEKKLKEHEQKYLSTETYPLLVSKMIASSLDAHSMVYGYEEISSINSHLKSRFEGIGIYIGDGIDGPEITGCVKGGPAERSMMVQPGDHIRYINGMDVTDVSFQRVMQMLSVRDGETILLHLESKSGKRKMVKLHGERIAMKKDKITLETEDFLDGQIAKLRVDTFYNDFEGQALSSDLKIMISQLRAQKPLYGIIIDMRKNLGGFFREAVKSIALFSAKETVVVAKFRDEQVRYSKEFDPHNTYSGPIVILTSKHSASAAEILAQSLQDVGIAIIAGDTRTYGKGSIQFQTITDPNSVHKYKVTVGKYYTISGTSTQLKGVAADIIVPTEYANQRIGEEYLPYALPSGDLNKIHGMNPEVRDIFAYHNSRQKTVYEVMRPRLKRNSEQRIANSKNYQAFIRSLDSNSYKEYVTKEERRKAMYGVNDLQMTEAVNIVKDMHSILQSYK